MLRRLIYLALGVYFSLCVVAKTGWTQTITGTITGTVTDPSGAVFPNVKVAGTNIDTNLTYSAQTNSAGVFNLLFLPAGSFNVSAEAAGFKRVVLGPFKLEVAQTARVDIKMQVGQLTQSVEVQGISPILQTETAQTGDTITGTQATALPLNGRNFLSLILLIPGAITPNPGSFTAPSRAFGGGRPYVNGNREQTNNFLLDGVDINESIDNLVGYNPNVDALEEVKVLTGNAAAEFGNSNGATVNMTLKSGTNNFHGNAFDFLRNDKLDANSFFNNRSGAKKRALRQNIFGGTFGGPIVKNRVFFFADYQGTRQRNSGPALATVAPLQFRTGNLSLFPTAIKDPNGGFFPGNMIPPGRIVNPVAQALFSDTTLYPLPNNPGTGLLGITSNYLSSSATFLNNAQGDGKIDSRLSDKDMLSGRFSVARYHSGTSKVALPAFLGSETEAPTTGGVVTWTRTFSPTVVNEARIGYTRVVINNTTTDPAGLLGSGGNQKLGIPGGQPIAGASSIVLAQNEGISAIGAGAADSSTVDNTYQYGNNLTYQRGRHLVKGGFQAIRYQQNRFYAGNNGLLGNFTYDGTYTGNGFADFLLNLLHSKGRGSQTGKWGHRQWRTAAFFQDDFKLRPNFTLNLGLRWEYTQPVYESKDREANVDLVTGNELFAGKGGNSRALYDPYYKQFMPRFGFAWTPTRLNNNFVARGGIGITSFMEGTGANLRLPLNPPFFFESAITYDLNAPGDIRAGFTDVLPQNTLSGQVRAWNPQLRPAFIEQWNLSFEYELSSSFSLNAGYVGQKGTHLVDPREFNQPLPDPGPVNTWRLLQQRRRLFAVAPLITNISGTDSSATMNYHALQVNGRKRLKGGLEFLAAYTLSKTLTDNLGYYGSVGVNAEGAYWQNAYDRRSDRGPAFFDARHNFSLGGSYDLPVGRGRSVGKSWSRTADSILGGWNVQYIVSMHSGFPITITSTDRTNQAVRGATRANRYGNFTYANQSIDSWFGTGNTFCAAGVNDGKCAYGEMASGTFGNASKGTERAPDFRTLDLSVGKKFSVTEKTYLDFRAEFFNAFNHSSFGPPARSISSQSNFGSITTTITSPRNVELGLKYYF